LAKDIFTSGVPADRVPPKTPPQGLYDSFQPGDLIYQTAEFMGAQRAHYAVYLGKIDGVHKVFDTSVKKHRGSSASVLSVRTIQKAHGNGTSYALASRADGDTSKKPTREELLTIVNKLNGKTFDWTGFETNCETAARAIVNDLPISTQTKDVSPMTAALTKAVLSAAASKGYRQRAVKQQNISNLVTRVMSNKLSPRLDKKCGASGIPDGAKCRKGGSWPTAAVIGTALTAGGIAAFTLSRQAPSGGQGGTPQLKGSPDITPAGLPGFKPHGLLRPGTPPKSKTQRMRENTAAAMKAAEGRIGQTAKEEVRRIAQIGNTMAATGEAAGMATKTTLRELRLRTEAARRRYEPGYRRNPKPAAQAPKTLTGGASPVQIPFSPAQPLTPERVGVDPRTGQPRRRKARGFTGDTEDGKKYTKVVTNPKTGRKNKVRYGAKGYTIAPGTSKGDNYCTRSFGDMKSEGYDCSGAERNTPLCLSRAKWKCSGKTSRRDTALTPGKSSAW
jgi:hypothetical protein